jgi:hypothetical protein
VVVAVTGDTFNEPDETFFLNLSNPTNATLARNQAVATIISDDPIPTLSINDVSIAEGNSGTANFVFTVTLFRRGGRDGDSPIRDGDGSATVGSDYSSVSGTVAFPPGSVSQTISISVNGDLLYDRTRRSW